MALRLSASEAKRLGVKLTASEANSATRAIMPAGGGQVLAWSLSLTVPTRVKSEANSREHWAVRNRRKKEQWAALALAASFLCERGMPKRGSLFPMTTAKPLVVTWTHIGRKMDRHENLPAAFKGLTDYLSMLFDLDDGQEDLVTWRYEQRAGAPGVEVRIDGGGA